ncbi:MAG: Ppx/GppA phosphatase family protein [Bryobacteraceae bacterium]
MPRYAAVDIGSNSVRLQVAETVPSSNPDAAPPRILATEREVTRLGESVFRQGRVSPQAIEETCGVLSRMARIYEKYNVAGIRAVATSAIRDSGNQDEFLARASEAIGTPVEIISGVEESRLIHLGVQSRWPQKNRKLVIVDIGGGSAEIVLSEEGRMAAAFSKPLGAVRLTEVFIKNDPPTERELHRLDEFIAAKIASAVRRVGAVKVDRAIATSATAAAVVCAINRVPRSERENADRLRATAPQINKLFRAISTQNAAARRKIPGIGPRRAEIIVAGLAVLRRILQDLGLPSVHYSSAGVRDGIIADLAARGVGRDLSRPSPEQRRAVEELARRFGVPLAHARKVADMAHILFDSLHAIHKLPADFGKLLHAAAVLHDVGHYVSDTRHHKHSFYVIDNSDLPGFTDRERHLIAHLCRYHRKSMPTPLHSSFQSLPAEDRRSVVYLIPLLRLADALDRSRRQLIEGMECRLRNGDIQIRLRSEMDPDLEIWAGERVTDAFQEVYGQRLVLVKS